MQGAQIKGWGLGLLLLGSCLSATISDLPSAPDAQSQLIILTFDGQPPQAWFLDPSQPQPDLVWPRHARIHLLAFTESPETLQLDPGPVELLTDSPPLGRRLPAPQSTHTGVHEGGRLVWGLTPSSDLDAFRQLRMAPFDDNRCTRAGGCRVDPDIPICKLPCPSSIPPERPSLPRLSQIEGWLPFERNGQPVVTPSGTPVLAPKEPARLRCPPAQMHYLDEEACRPVLACPAAEQWPLSLPNGALFVRAGSPGGDGSAARPYATLQDALQASPASAPIVFDGTFDFEAQVAERPGTLVGRELRGVCPERSILTTSGATTLTEGALSLYGLSLHLGGELELLSDNSQHNFRFIAIENSSLAVHNGSLHISDSRIYARGDSLLVVANGGTLEIDRAFFDVDYAMHLFNHTTLIIRDTLLEASGEGEGHGVSGSNFRSVEVKNTVFRGFRASGIAIQRVPRIDIADSQFLDINQHGLSLQACANRTECLPAGEDGFAINVQVVRTRIRSDTTGLLFAHGKLQMEDVVIEKSRTAVTLLGEIDAATEISLTRVATVDIGKQGLRLNARGGLPKTLRLQDVYVQAGMGGSSSLFSMVRSQFFNVEANRIHITSSPGHGMEILCGGGQITDLTIDRTDFIGLRLVPAQPVQIARLKITAPEALIIYANDLSAIDGVSPCFDLPNNAPSVSATDVTLSGGPRARRGLTMCSGGEAYLERTSISNFDTGIYIQRDGLKILDARIQAHRIGVSTWSGAARLPQLLQVQFDSNSGTYKARPATENSCPQLGASGS